VKYPHYELKPWPTWSPPEEPVWAFHVTVAHEPHVPGKFWTLPETYATVRVNLNAEPEMEIYVLSWGKTYRLGPLDDFESLTPPLAAIADQILLAFELVQADIDATLRS
jgi:hypothetical protein